MLNFVLIFIFGLIVGAWHEGFTFPVLVGFMAVFIAKKEYRSPKYVVAMVALGIGLLFLMSFPSVFLRIGRETEYKSFAAIELVRTFLKHPLVPVFVVGLIAYIWKRSVGTARFRQFFYSFRCHARFRYQWNFSSLKRAEQDGGQTSPRL